VTSVARNKEAAAFGISSTMARALADPWRIRILIEVTVRPLSPSRFVEEVGGELTHVARCFRQLAQWGYIEVVEERPGRRGGAAIEHIYRAIRRAHFDTCSWMSVPRTERDAASRSVLNSYQQRLGEALDAGTFDQELDRHFSWDAIALDRQAWEELGSRMDAVLDSLSDHEFAASKRLQNAKDEQIPATVGLTMFRSPELASHLVQGVRRYQGLLEGVEPRPLHAVGPKLAKALSNKWRCKILMEVSVRPLSPSQFVEEIGGSMTHISRCFRDLAGWGYLEVKEERRGGRRGGVERIYRSTLRPYFDTPTWETLPQVLREEISRFILETYFDRIFKAIEAGTFDAEIDRHLSWKPIVIDRPSWNAVTESLDQVLAWLPELERDSLSRSEDTHLLIPTTVGLACFRSPSPARR
jgi:hypothetical protein